MYKTQRGCFPLLITTIGTIFFVVFIAYLLFFNIESWFNNGTALPANGTLKFIFSHVIFDLIILLLFMPAPIFFARMFPMVRLTKDGVRYRYLGLLGGRIRYDEIDEIADLKRPPGYKVIVISRKGFFLFTGGWMFTMYGLAFTGQAIPVLVLSPSLEDRDKFIEDIQKNKSGLIRKIHFKKHSHFIWLHKFGRAKNAVIK